MTTTSTLNFIKYDMKESRYVVVMVVVLLSLVLVYL